MLSTRKRRKKKDEKIIFLKLNCQYTHNSIEYTHIIFLTSIKIVLHKKYL